MAEPEKHEEQKPKEGKQNVWNILIILICIGVVMQLALASGFKDVEGADYFYTVAIGLLIGGAFFAAGGFIGFLFGIPKLIPKANGASTSDITEIEQNDNLVEISDWLTKIIVGVGLTQLYNLPEYILRLGKKFGPSFDGARRINNALATANERIVNSADSVLRSVTDATDSTAVLLDSTKRIASQLLDSARADTDSVSLVAKQLSNTIASQPISGQNAAIATICYFAIVGFLSVYLWTRLKFPTLLKDVTKLLDEKSINAVIAKKITESQAVIDQKITESTAVIDQKITENAAFVDQKIIDSVEDQDRKLKLSELNNRIEQFEKARTVITNSENNLDDLKESFKHFTPGPVKILDDAQQMRWGGLPSKNGISVSAEISESPDLESHGHKVFAIKIFVKGSQNAPLTGKVFFFLHESYIPNQIVVVEAKNNLAETAVESYQAFTVGVLCQKSNIALELDLNKLVDAPIDYKYSEPLKNVDDLYAERNSLLSSTFQ